MGNRVVHVCFAQCINIAVKSGAEQQALAAWLGEVQDFAHDWHEAHVCHLVSFVKHGDFNTAQVN